MSVDNLDTLQNFYENQDSEMEPIIVANPIINPTQKVVRTYDVNVYVVTI